MISGFNIVVFTSLHILKDWPCVLKVACLSLPIKSAITQAIEDAIKPLQDCINKQNVKITSLKAENEQMKGKLNKRIEQIEDRYDKFRNMANVCPRILQENDDLKHEVNPITKTAYQLTFTVVYRPNNVGAINIVFG
jgi:septal ring factor EnvC (AmiA/AmiB activator)